MMWIFQLFILKVKRDNTQYIDGSRGSQIIDELAPNENDLIVYKSYKGSLYSVIRGAKYE